MTLKKKGEGESGNWCRNDFKQAKKTEKEYSKLQIG